MNRRVLMIYDRFPPFNVSGTARAFHFAKHLPEFGWHPVVLSGQPLPDEPHDTAPLAELGPEVTVLRAGAWLTPRKDRLARWLNRQRLRLRTAASPEPPPGPSRNAEGGASPSKRVFRRDSWAWRATGLPLWAIESHLDWAPPALLEVLRRPEGRAVDVVWVSSPHVRNLFVGEALSHLLRRPLVVDLRDPWTYGSLWFPRGRWVEAVEVARARRLLSHAARVVVTSPLTRVEMERRFPDARFATITNGFASDESITPLRDVALDRCLFRYVGVLNERRTPDTLLKGLALACEDPELRKTVHLEFVGEMAGHEHKLQQFGLGDVTSYRHRVSQHESLRLMRGSDVNVVLQTISDGQDVIAGKTFEYLAAHKPIVAVVSPAGGDAWLLGQVGGAHIAAHSSPEQIAKAIRAAYDDFMRGSGAPAPERLAPFSRRELAKSLAKLLNEVVSEP